MTNNGLGTDNFTLSPLQITLFLEVGFSKSKCVHSSADACLVLLRVHNLLHDIGHAHQDLDPTTLLAHLDRGRCFNLVQAYMLVSDCCSPSHDPGLRLLGDLHLCACCIFMALLGWATCGTLRQSSCAAIRSWSHQHLLRCCCVRTASSQLLETQYILAKKDWSADYLHGRHVGDYMQYSACCLSSLNLQVLTYLSGPPSVSRQDRPLHQPDLGV